MEAMGGKRRIKPAKANKGTIPLKVTASVLEELLESQQYRCALTGLLLTPETANVDHIIPLVRGGEHDASNAQIILDYVNKAKGTMTNDEFIQMCRDVATNADEPAGPISLV